MGDEQANAKGAKKTKPSKRAAPDTLRETKPAKKVTKKKVLKKVKKKASSRAGLFES